MAEAPHKTADSIAEERIDLALERTAMASDRTLMAWTRTSLSMISFGFTLFKFMQYMHEGDRRPLIKSPQGAENFGITLVAIGILSLVIACIQYWRFEKKLGLDRKWYTNPTLLSAGIIGGMGCLALINALFRIGPF